MSESDNREFTMAPLSTETMTEAQAEKATRDMYMDAEGERREYKLSQHAMDTLGQIFLHLTIMAEAADLPEMQKFLSVEEQRKQFENTANINAVLERLQFHLMDNNELLIVNLQEALQVPPVVEDIINSIIEADDDE